MASTARGWRNRGLLRIGAAVTAVGCFVAAGGVVASQPAGAAPAWTAKAHTRPQVAVDAVLDGISCAGPTNCTAVGSTVTPTAENTLVEHWNGTAWAMAAAPSVPGAVSSHLRGISCADVIHCTAVGDADGAPLIASSSAGLWTLQSAGVSKGSLTSVSCTASTSCIAVGAMPSGSVSETPLVLRWNGVTWAQLATPAVGSPDSRLNAVSCFRAITCVAVGQIVSNDYDTTNPLTEHWNGTTWAIDPAPSNGSDVLNGIDCISLTNCQAVGSSFDTPVAMKWNGKAWSAVAVPPTLGAGLNAVRCRTALNCTAVGGIDSGKAPLIVNYNGILWSPVSAAAASGPAPSLDAIVCPRTGCLAVGATDAAPARLLAERGSVGAWSIVAVPAPMGDASGEFAGVTCRLTADCLAVGSYWDPAAGVGRPFAEHFNGSAWLPQTVPSPTGSIAAELDGAFCTGATECFGVGSARAATGLERPLLERWNGSAWSILTLPLPSGATGGSLRSVTCSSVTSCIAVGTWASASGDFHVLIERGQSTTWALQSAPEPAGTTDRVLSGVACRAATDCSAVGLENASGHALVEHWNGSVWALISTPNPGASNILGAVSCTATACTAVGTTWNGSAYAALALRWNGVAWLSQPTAHVSSLDQFNGVSCSATTSCIAVGSAGNKPLIEAWNGVSWSNQTAPALALASDGVLSGVACPSTVNCAAVGFFDVTLADGASAQATAIDAYA